MLEDYETAEISPDIYNSLVSNSFEQMGKHLTTN